jgi:hypothetical protein
MFAEQRLDRIFNQVAPPGRSCIQQLPKSAAIVPLMKENVIWDPVVCVISDGLPSLMGIRLLLLAFESSWRITKQGSVHDSNYSQCRNARLLGTTDGSPAFHGIDLASSQRSKFMRRPHQQSRVRKFLLGQAKHSSKDQKRRWRDGEQLRQCFLVNRCEALSLHNCNVVSLPEVSEFIEGGLVHIREVWSKLFQIQTACDASVDGRMFSRAMALRH